MSKQIGMFVTAVAMLILAGQARANLVSNGGFETSDFTDWTPGANFEFSSVNANNVHTGNFSAELGPVGSPGTLSQTFNTVPGKTYDLEFFLDNDGSIPTEFYVQWDGTTLEDLSNPPSFGYTQQDFLEVATSASTVLTFGFQNDVLYFYLDDISVNPVPEPVTATLGLLGLCGLGLATLRRRAR